ncbi:sensor histidine kinase [Spirochaetota bacterium]
MQENKSELRQLFFKDLRFTVDLSISFRWAIAITLLVLPFTLPYLNININTIPIVITAFIILLYNSFFFFTLKTRLKNFKNEWDPGLFPLYRNIGRLQIIFDYITLVVVLYYIGGLHTNLFFIILFHLILGSIILSRYYMYAITIITIIIYAILSLLELHDIIPYYNIYNIPKMTTYRTIFINTVIHSGTMFSVIILVSILSNRIRDDNIQLGAIKQKLEVNLEAITALEIRKSKFMRQSAHQLRSPLATIISALNVLHKKLIPIDSERAYNLIDGAHDRATSLLNIVKELLSLSRIREEKNNILYNYNLNLILLIEEIIYTNNQLIEKTNLSIKRIYRINGEKFIQDHIFHDQKSLAEFVKSMPRGNLAKGNRENLKDAFSNLIQNAIKYSHDNGSITIEMIFNNSTNHCTFKICDEGIGIDKEYIDEIFIEFVRSPNAKEYQNEGTGLGLAIAKEVFNAHRSEISVTSIKDEGTVFTVSINLDGAI